jgi:hypothetical protein
MFAHFEQLNSKIKKRTRKKEFATLPLYLLRDDKQQTLV